MTLEGFSKIKIQDWNGENHLVVCAEKPGQVERYFACGESLEGSGKDVVRSKKAFGG